MQDKDNNLSTAKGAEKERVSPGEIREGDKLLDRSRLQMAPLEQRMHNLDLSVISSVSRNDAMADRFKEVAERILRAKAGGAAVVLMMGAHVLRSGVQKYLIYLIERGYIDCIATNGACVIHDYEFSLIGKTTESVSRYIRDGRFGFWRELGRINDIITAAAQENMGIGEAIGKAIVHERLPHQDISLYAACFRNNIPITVHVGIGYDITHQLPNCDGAAYGACSYLDFLKFAHVLERLEGGAVLVFGSAVMAPEVFLKALSMARNIARQQGRHIRDFTTLVCDLYSIPTDYDSEPDTGSAAYYFRPWKTLLVRTVIGGGKSVYVRGDHFKTIPGLYTALLNRESSARFEGKRIVQQGAQDTETGNEEKKKLLDLEVLAARLEGLRKRGRKIVHCHGCFDLMHPGHIKYFQSAKKMGDVLVVTVTPDRFVDKGPGRPVFGEMLRAESIAALQCVDYVSINRWSTAERTLRLLKPNTYVKGQEFKNLEDKSGKIQKECNVVQEIGADIRFTNEIVFSSTELLRNHFPGSACVRSAYEK